MSVTLHVLLNLIASDELGVDMSLMQESDSEKRSTLMLQQADKMGCRKFAQPKVHVIPWPCLRFALCPW